MAQRLQIEPDGSDSTGNGKTAYQCSGCFGRGSSLTRRMLPTYEKQIRYCSECRDAACLLYLKGEVRNLTIGSRNSSLAIWHMTKDKEETARRTGIKKAVIDVLIRDEFSRLAERFRPWKLALIASAAKDRSIPKKVTLRRFRITECQLAMVCTIDSQNRQAAHKESQKAWDKLSKRNQAQIKEVCREAYFAAFGVCEGDSKSPIRSEDLLSPSIVKAVAWIGHAISDTAAKVSEYVMDGFGLKAAKIIRVSRLRHKQAVIRAMAARAAGLKIHRGKRKPQSNVIPFEPGMNRAQIAQAMTIFALAA
jgi:hypothetical protein